MNGESVAPRADDRQAERWVFVLDVRHRPGAVAMVTREFSGRGISLESSLGYPVLAGARPPAAPREAVGRVVVCCECSERRRTWTGRSTRCVPPAR